MRLALLALIAGCADTGPHLISVTPAHVDNNATEMVTITGERMCAGNCAQAAGEFVLDYDSAGSMKLSVVTLDDASAQVAVPEGTPVGQGLIVLTVNGSSSNALAFSVGHVSQGGLQ